MNKIMSKRLKALGKKRILSCLSLCVIMIFSVSIFQNESYANTVITEGLSLQHIYGGDDIENFEVEDVTALYVNDDIEIRIYYTGEGIMRYNMFNPPDGNKMQVIKEFSQDDADNGYLSLRYPIDEFKKFGIVTIFMRNDYSKNEHIYLKVSDIKFDNIPETFSFNNEKLENAIMFSLNKSTSFTSEDIINIKVLDLSDKNLSDLNGLSLLNNLESINIANNNISDLTELNQLENLNTLYISGNPIDDLVPIEDIFDNLIKSDFTKNQIRTIYGNRLKEIGVFRGTDAGLELDREPTRLEGLIMLIRLLGKESDAIVTDTSVSVFDDVPSWGIAYTNYAYNNGLTYGLGDGKFGSSNPLNAKSYITFILRALGYDDAQGDFAWNDAIFNAQSFGIYDNSMQIELNNNTFLRSHIAEISYKALGTNLKGEESLLIQKLVSENIINEEIAKKMGFEIITN